MAAFELDPKLAADTAEVDRWDLCRVLLMEDANYPWLVLVPARAGLRDFHDLATEDLPVMTAEIVRASKALEALFDPVKLNVAALGNQVAQLHIHVIARRVDDAAWPKPVWGAAPARAYDDEARSQRIASLQEAFMRF
ncbi:MAG: HIT family protein [Alphaproteobacteria bacterium]|nr:HIT family protein [Alphaproteobacteria bacterium]